MKALGYPAKDYDLWPDYTTAIATELEALLTDIDNIDAAMMALSADSNVTQLDSIKLDVKGGLKSLRIQGSLKLNHLSAITGYPLVSNKYINTVKLSIKG